MKISFSWDDGALEDKKLFELHEKYDIPAMFFIPTVNREGREVISPNIIRQAESKNIRFGGHTANHTYLTTIPLDTVEKEVVTNKYYLEDILGHEVNDFCLPGGKYDENILKIVFKHYETVRTADIMNFRYRGGALKPAIHFYPRGIKSLIGNAIRNKSYPQLMYVITHSFKNYFQLINGILEKERNKEDSVCMVWGHSWEIEQYNLWDDLETFFNYVKQYSCSEYKDLFKLKGQKL